MPRKVSSSLTFTPTQDPIVVPVAEHGPPIRGTSPSPMEDTPDDVEGGNLQFSGVPENVGALQGSRSHYPMYYNLTYEIVAVLDLISQYAHKNCVAPLPLVKQMVPIMFTHFGGEYDPSGKPKRAATSWNAYEKLHWPQESGGLLF